MKVRITESRLKRFYRLLSVPMIDFDCGQLCAPKNGGIPSCCENEYVVPLLFQEEYSWHRKNGGFWKKMPSTNKTIKKFMDESESYYVFCQCPGPSHCIRSGRSLNCMTFPFEPHVHKGGDVVGLAYINGNDVACPLIGKSRRIYNPAYIANSIAFWKELFISYPQERELYIQESRKRERRANRQKRRVQVFRAR